MPGGWYAAEPDGLAREALAEAVRQQASGSKVQLELLAVEKLEQQVVAGMNYRARLRVREGGAERRATATAFRGLDGQVALRDWRWLPAP